VFQHSPKPAGGDWSCSPEGLHLVHIAVHLLNLCVAQGKGAPHRPCLRHRCHGPPPATVAPQQVSPELLGSPGLPTRSQKALPPVICAETRRAVASAAVAHFVVPDNQRVDD
jgi:hypothetical protein